MIPKFRAWDKQNRTMYEVKSIIYTLKRVMGFNRSSIHGVKSFSFDDVELMQSTGLVDKNGVEIFEGDVVTLVEESGDFAKSQVTFECGSFGLTIEGLFIPFGALSLMAQVEYSLEIIGNIYENPVEVGVGNEIN